METGKIRLLFAEEIECRVSSINAKGLSLLLYKDARVDQKILDETFGLFGWKRSHQCIDGSLYCTVEIFDKERGEWVSKQDVGATGYTEKEKSQASDSFKRACFNWGIGRELYSAPFIWIPAGKANIQTKDGNKYFCHDRFTVKSIAYNDSREIAGLQLVNGNGITVYEWQDKKEGRKQTASGAAKEPTGGAMALSQEQMVTLQSELKRTGVGMEAIKERYQVGTPEEMSPQLYERVMKALAKTKSSDAA